MRWRLRWPKAEAYGGRGALGVENEQHGVLPREAAPARLPTRGVTVGHRRQSLAVETPSTAAVALT